LFKRLAPDNVMTFDDLLVAGKELQGFDADFATIRIGEPFDPIHDLAGPNSQHPYAKIAICRSAFSVRLAPQKIVDFLYEKFLVCYNYLDSGGTLRPTITPVHSHPLNFETVYFLNADNTSKVMEAEYILRQRSGRAVLLHDGSLDPEFVAKASSGSVALE